MSALANEIVDVASAWYRKGCVESSTNRGVCIDEIHALFDPQWIRNKTSDAWCAKFVWVVVNEAVRRLGGVNLLPHTASAGGMLNASRKVLGVDTSAAIGSVFMRNSAQAASGKHTGIVVGLAPGRMITIEGNLDNRVALYAYPYADVRSAKTGFEFIHTERMGVPLTAGFGGIGTLLLLGAAVGLGYQWLKK